MDKQSPKISILILNWNGIKHTLECLESVTKIDYDNFEIVVLDNGSSDGSVDVIREKFPQVVLIENGENLGYAEGNNRGIAYSIANNFNYIFVLNNDTVVDSQILKNFLAASLENPNAGILGAKIYYKNEPDKIWFAGGSWSTTRAQFDHLGYNQLDNIENWNDLKSTDYACGCAFFIKSDLVKEIGLFDSRYFLTWEESDYCYQARKAGFQCLFVPSAKVWHKVSASFHGQDSGMLYQYFSSRNRLLWIEKNLTYPEKLRIYFFVILPELKKHFRVLISLRTLPIYRIRAKVSLSAFRDYLLRRFGDCPPWVRQITLLN